MRDRKAIGRGAAILGGGVVVGILGRRFLPRLVGKALRLRERRGEDGFDGLIQEHGDILDLLEEMAETRLAAPVRRSHVFLQLKRKLAKHTLAEEAVVYPMLHQEANDPMLTKRLFDQHADIKILLFDLEKRLMSNEDWRSEVRSLRDLLRRHTDTLEGEVFPKLRQLGRAALPALSLQIEREEALIP
jgi:hypothetical protein